LAVLDQKDMVHVDEPTGRALLHAQLGERDRAFQWLDTAAERRVSRVTNINVDPGFQVLHDDPRWDVLLKRIGLPKVQPPPVTNAAMPDTQPASARTLTGR
jgi:hypothetical protein